MTRLALGLALATFAPAAGPDSALGEPIRWSHSGSGGVYDYIGDIGDDTFEPPSMRLSPTGVIGNESEPGQRQRIYP